MSGRSSQTAGDGSPSSMQLEPFMTPRTLSPSPPRSRAATRLIDSDVFVILIALVVAGLAQVMLITEPERVDLAVANPTPFTITVQLEDADGVLPLASIRDGETARLVDVIDQGDRWTFTFASQGRDAGSVRVDRDTLAAAGWQLEIPAAVTDRLEQQGATPNP
jgi:hypothetical protein